jgi:hypothetical protein
VLDSLPLSGGGFGWGSLRFSNFCRRQGIGWLLARRCRWGGACG